MSKLRMSSHRLNIETCRWNRPIPTIINERICSVCHVLEDEFHFVLECELYSSIRNIYIPLYYRINPSMFKFTELINCENKNVTISMSVYIKKAFEIRNNFHYT